MLTFLDLNKTKYTTSMSISANKTLYISPSGNDTTGSGTVGAPWATLSKALTYLSDKIISGNATVTIELADGVYNHTTDTIFNHDNGDRIFINGKNTYSKSLSSIISSTGSTGAWSIVLQLDTVTNISINDYVIIRNTTGGTNPTYIQGVHKITDVNGSLNQITISSYHRGTVAPSGAVTNSNGVIVLKSIISCVGCGGIIIKDFVELGYLENLAFVGDNTLYKSAIGTTTYSGTMWEQQGGTIKIGKNVASSNFYMGLSARGGNSTILCESFTHSGGTYGVMSSWNSQVTVTNPTIISGCSSVGGTCDNGSYLNIGAGVITGCATGIQATNNAIASCGNAYITNNSNGLYATTSACILSNGSTISNNTNIGLYTLTDGIIYTTTANTFSGNGIDRFIESTSSLDTWSYVSSPGRTSDSVITVTDNAANQAIFIKGRPVKFRQNDASPWQYAIVTNYSAGSVTIAGSPYTSTIYSSSTRTFTYSDLTRIEQLTFNIPGNFATGASTSLLQDAVNTFFKWTSSQCAIVQINHRVKTPDSGATQPNVNVYANGVAVSNANTNAGRAISSTWVDTDIDINTSNYFLSFGQSVEISVDASGTNKDAKDLTVNITLVRI